jgi:hypothetical protein
VVGTDSGLRSMADLDISSSATIVMQKGTNKPQVPWFLEWIQNLSIVNKGES